MKRVAFGALAVAVVAGSAQAALFTYSSPWRSVSADNLVYHDVEGYPVGVSSDRTGSFVAGASASWQREQSSAWQSSHFGGHFIIASGYAECELFSGAPGGTANTYVSTTFVLDEAMPNSEVSASIAALAGAMPAPNAGVFITGPGIGYDSSVDGPTFSWSGTLQPGTYTVVASVGVGYPYQGKVGSEFALRIVPTPGTLALGALAMLAMRRGRRRHGAA